MIWFFTPYSFEGNLFDTYDRYFSFVKNTEDWVVLTDGDTFFFYSNFGHIIQNCIERYPDTGFFTAILIGLKQNHHFL